MNRRKHIIYYIGQVATSALLEEVSTTPKPGLVDRVNSGGHSDMDFFTFINSSSALSPYFFKMAQVGYDWEESLNDLFQKLREIGMEAEKAMFQATGGVNTHKGLVFSLGILSAAAAYYYKKNAVFDINAILLLCGEMTIHSLEKEFQGIKESSPQTKGEELYIKYGVKGIRGEVQGGFKNVREVALPIMIELRKQGKNKNDRLLQTLLYLMVAVEDTNVLARHDFETLRYVQETTAKALEKGGIFTKQGELFIQAMDKEFSQGRISPGGCADLLAVTVMSYKLSAYEKKATRKRGTCFGGRD